MTTPKHALKIPIGTHKIVLKDIANACDLSLISVSRALRGAKGVGPKTRAKVKEVALELGYIPNRAASILGSRHARSHIVGVIVPAFSHTIYPDVLESIELIMSDKDYQLLICTTNDDPGAELRKVISMLELQVDGIIMAPTSAKSNSEAIQLILQQGCPLVLIDRMLENADIDSVVFDNYNGAFESVSRVIASGCKRIACLSGCDESWNMQERVRGFKDAMRTAGLSFSPNDFFLTGLTISDGERVMNRILAGEVEYDCVLSLSVSSRVAIGAIKTLNRFGIRIPEDISMIGFCNTLEAETLKKTMTIIGLDAYALGEIASQKLIERIQNPRSHVKISAQRICIPTRLHIHK